MPSVRNKKLQTLNILNNYAYVR